MKWNAFVLAVAAFIVVAGLQSCGNERVVSAATLAVDDRDYKQALGDILSLSDSEILDSDTLMQLLSTAFYGLSMTQTREIAIDCYDMDFAPDGKTVVFTDFNNGSLKFYSFPDMEFERSILLPKRAFSIDISPDGEQFAAAMTDNSILIYNFESGERIDRLKGHAASVRDVAFRDKNMLFPCGNDRAIAAWDLIKSAPCWARRQHEKNIKSLHLSKDKTRIVTASNDGSSTVVTAADDGLGNEKLRLVHGDNYVNDAAISPDNSFVVTVSGDGSVKIWDADNGTKRNRIFLDDPLNSVDISDDGNYILIGGVGNAYVLESGSGRIEAVIHAANTPIWSVKFTDKKRFAFADNSRLWQGKLVTGKKLIEEARKLN